MARKKTSKSQAIRDVLTENPKLMAKEVVDQLAAKGVKVTPNLVYFIKGKMAQKKSTATKKAKRVARAASAAASPNHADPLAAILAIKELAKKLGGIQKLKGLVDGIPGANVHELACASPQK